MFWIAVAVAVLGALLLLVGFIRNRRGLLALSAVVLFVAGSLGGFLDRWVQTAYQAEAEARALNGLPPPPAAAAPVDAAPDTALPTEPTPAPMPAPAAPAPAGTEPTPPTP